MAHGLSTRWYALLDATGRSGAENMAIDETLLYAARCSGALYLRLYRWHPGTLSFGRHEPALQRYDRDRIARWGWPVVRRPTGGRAVWHEQEVTYAVAAPLERWGSLRRSYRAIHALLAEALAALGVEARLAGDARTPGAGAGPCFATTAGGEIVVRGRKLVGSAQVRDGSALLQHGSILLDGDQARVQAAARTPAAPPAATTLSAELGRSPDFHEVAHAIVARAAVVWGEPAPRPPPLPPPDLARYVSTAWTWRR